MEKLELMILVLLFLNILTKDSIFFATSCSKSDNDALIDFKNGLIDSGNRLSSWLNNTDCCKWRGIECDDISGAVRAVDLQNPYASSDLTTITRYDSFRLTGEIRPSLLKLKFLTRLDLSFNAFQGMPIPKFFGSLKNLEYLNLSNADFSGPIPLTIGNLSQMQYLDFSCRLPMLSLADFALLSGLVNLRHLNFDQVDLTLVGPNWSLVLAKLGHLTELHMSGCGLSGDFPSLPILNFTSLSILDLSSNSFNSRFPFWVANMSSLISVDLSFCDFRGRIPLGLGELPNLKYLNLIGNNELRANAFRFFQGTWRKIEVLKLGLNKLHGKLPALIGNMTFLSVFDLFMNEIEGGIPGSIGGLCSLVNFDMSSNNLTEVLPEILEASGNCGSTRPLPNLLYLRLNNNKLNGKVPEWLGKIESLVEIGLRDNLLEGTIPPSVGSLKNLIKFEIGGNNINGTLPVSIGQLSNLELLDVSSNRLSGIVSEVHFLRLRNLTILRMSSNSFVFNVSSEWDPPFKARNLDMGSCRLGPLFPSWIQSQNQLMLLDISNASISGTIPLWFWEISSNLTLLNVSLNHLEGRLPNPFSIFFYAAVDFSSNLFEGPFPLPSSTIELLDLSRNKLSGQIPQNLSKCVPDLVFLSLSNNQITGEIPITIGEMTYLEVIDFSNNNMTGIIPSAMGDCSLLKVLDLGNNHFLGEIPISLGNLKQLQSIHLSDNKILGKLPFSLAHLSSLETLDFGGNNISGKIPRWVGNALSSLRILNLRSNSLFGNIPSELCNLRSLQVLDLADNNFSGEIPPSFSGFKAMVQEQKENKYRFYGSFRGTYYEESLVLNTKGQLQKYTKTLSLVISIDLSRNQLTGEISIELTKLLGLVVLNLSMNHISGPIPQRISDLHQLASLDLSSNKFEGPIPQSMNSLTFLSYLNLSKNDFVGRIPNAGQMATFADGCFEENPGLCGAPLAVKCQSSSSDDPDQVETVEDENGGGFIDKWFYSSVGFGFAFGILFPFIILSFRKSWSDAYFNLVEKIVGNYSKRKRN